MNMRRNVAASAAVLVIGLVAGGMTFPVSADTIIERWKDVTAPPPPELKTVTTDPKSTALLLLDFSKQSCGPRPRCIATLPQIEKFAAAP